MKKNCTCASCDVICLPTKINSSIGFFDGFDWKMVLIVYGCLIVASIAIFFMKKYFNKKKVEKLNE